MINADSSEARLFERYGKKSALMVIGQAGEQLMNIAGICNTDMRGAPAGCAPGADSGQ